GVDGDDRELRGELRSVRAQRRHLDPAAQHRTLAGGEISSESLPVLSSESRWDDELRHPSTQHIRTAISECPLGGAIELEDPPLVIDCYDPVERRLHDPSRASFTLPDARLRMPSLGDVVEHQNDADRATAAIANRRGAVIDGPLRTIPGDHQDRVVRPTDD